MYWIIVKPIVNIPPLYDVSDYIENVNFGNNI